MTTLDLTVDIQNRKFYVNNRLATEVERFIFTRQDQVQFRVQPVKRNLVGGIRNQIEIVNVTPLDLQMAVGAWNAPYAAQVDWTKDEDNDWFTGTLNFNTVPLEDDATGKFKANPSPASIPAKFHVRFLDAGQPISVIVDCEIRNAVLVTGAPVPEEIDPPSALVANLALIFADSNSVAVQQTGDQFRWHVRRKTGGGVYEDADGIYTAMPANGSLFTGPLRLESPQAPPGYQLAGSAEISAGGSAGQAFWQTLHVRGVVERRNYGGAAYSHFVPENNGGGPWDVWMLEVSSPPATYYLNGAISGESQSPQAIDYSATIVIAAGATLTLSHDPVDAWQASNPGIVIPDIPPYPDSYEGQFLQIDFVPGAAGTAGQDGKDAFVYVGYAEDAAGTGFSLTPDPARQYIAFRPSNVALTPVAADFAGLWVKYIGNDGAPGSGGGTSAQAITINATGTTTITPAASILNHFVEAVMDAGAYTHTIILDTANAGDGNRIAFHFTLPASANTLIEIRNATAEGTLLLHFTPRADAAIPRSVDCEFRAGAWRLVSTSELTDHVRLSGDTMAGPLHFPCETLAYAPNKGISLIGAKYQLITAIGDINFFTAFRSAGTGETRRVFVLLTADNAAGVGLTLAAGIRVLGGVVGTLADGKRCLIEFISTGPAETDTTAVVHGEVAVGGGDDGGGGGGGGGTDPSWLINLDFMANSAANPASAKGGAAAIGTASDFWNGIGYGLTATPLPLNFADHTVSGATLELNNASPVVASGPSAHDDAMFRNGLKSEDGSMFGFTIRNLPAGTWEIYLYGWGNPAPLYFTVVNSDNEPVIWNGGTGTDTNTVNADVNTTDPVWAEELHYAKMRFNWMSESAPLYVFVFPVFADGPYGGGQTLPTLSGIQLQKV